MRCAADRPGPGRRPARCVDLARARDPGRDGRGGSNSAIAQLLHLSVKTVESHVASVFAKLGLPPADDSNRRVLAVLAYLRAG